MKFRARPHRRTRTYRITHAETGDSFTVEAKTWDAASGKGRRQFRERGWDPKHVRTKQVLDG
jgi:hypothetical protein